MINNASVLAVLMNGGQQYLLILGNHGATATLDLMVAYCSPSALHQYEHQTCTQWLDAKTGNDTTLIWENATSDLVQCTSTVASILHALDTIVKTRHCM
ncbi:hypothetical protein XENTR_v10018114 [Xenopus tropicalis]|nr:hypothetical protein XENTR_v10018114 [Xenopus tropicalis]